MKASELNAVRLLKMRYEGYSLLLSRTISALTGISSVLNSLPTAQALTSRLEELTTRKIHYERLSAELRATIEKTALELATQIVQEYPDEIDQTLLLLRYVECLSWTQVAARMDYDRRHVLRLHKKIMMSLDNTT